MNNIIKNKLTLDIIKTDSKEQNLRFSDRIIEENFYYLVAKHIELNSHLMFTDEREEWCNLLEEINELRHKYYFPNKTPTYARQYDCKYHISLKDNNINYFTNKYKISIKEDTYFFTKLINQQNYIK